MYSKIGQNAAVRLTDADRLISLFETNNRSLVYCGFHSPFIAEIETNVTLGIMGESVTMRNVEDEDIG